MGNSIFQYAIGELLDGRYFYIPAYQRGYRWTEKQVGDLLRDLLCFAYDQKSDYDFYCLQPIIARPITNDKTLCEIFGDEQLQTVKDHTVWEIIDGQQRLTSLFLIYKYLLNAKGWDAETLKEEENGNELFHLQYATRDGSSEFLETISIAKVKSEDLTDAVKTNVDYYHMSEAFKYIDSWIKTDGKEINLRYNLGGSLSKVREALFSLLNAKCDTKTGSVQVLWYQLTEDTTNNSVKEFQKINTGKIKLTDAELIKGLFLQKKNFESGSQFIKQSEIALEWEFIENTLHANNFWYFLQKKGQDMPNRIDLLFNLIYKIEKLREIDESEWNTKLKEIDTLLQDTRQSEIFRFYYNRFEGKVGEELQKEVSETWKEVMTLFHTLDDWFCTPSLYNFIGLLSQCGEELCKLILHFNAMDEASERKDFEDYLIERIRYQLRGISLGKEKKEIKNSYGNKERGNLYKLLLTLNIHLLNEQNSLLESESDVYKFPFDVLNEQNWNIEHIASAHTNELKKDNLLVEWIETAQADCDLSDEDSDKIEAYKKDKNYNEAIKLLKEKAKEEELDEELKNSVGNLTLLDEVTNKKYGNSLFCTKRRIIIERIQEGVFVPTGTQYVFAKFFDKKGTSRSVWGESDIKAYHKYIYSKLAIYIDPKSDDNE